MEWDETKSNGILAAITRVNNIQERTLALFRETGAYLTGHFRLTSGLHSPEYLQCALVLQHPQHAEELGRHLAAALETMRLKDAAAAVADALGVAKSRVYAIGLAAKRTGQD